MIVLSILTIDMEAVAKRMLVLGAKDPGSTSMTSSCTKAKRLDVVFDVFPTTCPPFFILLPHEVLFLSFVRKILPRVASNERERERELFFPFCWHCLQSSFQRSLPEFGGDSAWR